MEQLIKTINKLQDAFSTAGITNLVNLPQIVVVGSQSSGKSSVLENIVRKDFLPRGSGIVTRRPLLLQLINIPRKTGEKNAEWGEFLHIPQKKFYDFEEIRSEIQSETDLTTGGGSSRGISSVPINLKIYSPNVLTLTLVDLPGLTKVPIGNQPYDIERQIRDMIMKYISESNAIILAVTPANTDLANSDGMKLAREVDPEGERTIGVLTKIDLMDKGTNVLDILAGHVIKLDLGYVPVVNRGQKDIDSKKTIEEALKSEREFFEKHPIYRPKADYCGTPFLSRRLNYVLMKHIGKTLPKIKDTIFVSLQNYESKLSAIGEDYGEENNKHMILNVIMEFCNEYKAILEGRSDNVSVTELNGGARIGFVFHEIFTNAVLAMDPLEDIKDVDIRTLLYNSSGPTPSLFVAGSGFELLAKSQIKRMEGPSIKCISLIYEELSRIISRLLHKPIFDRFIELKDRFKTCMDDFFRGTIEPTKKYVALVVAAECCYINTAHPDFLTGHQALSMVCEKINVGNKETNHDSKKNTQPSSTPSKSPLSLYPTQTNGSNALFSSFIPKKQEKRSAGILEPPPKVLKAIGSLSEREYVEIEVIKLLLISYFNIVKKTVMDMVPKIIMLNLVNHSKEGMQSFLVTNLYDKDISKELLRESKEITEKRKEYKRIISVLKDAYDTIIQ